MKWLTFLVAFVALSGSVVPVARADQAADEAEIRKSVAEYVAAFNAGDPSALAKLWSPEAVYVNPISGEQVVGQAAIEEQFTAIFAEAKGVKLTATTNSVQFISPSVAVEFGTANVVRPDQTPAESSYTAVFVKRDGKWLLDRVTEEDIPVVMSNYEHLKELEWMIGTWVDSDQQATVETKCEWTKNRNFMTRMFAISVGDRIESSGMQIIGWDPIAKQIRSWVFDSDGGFGEATWVKKDNAWHVQTSGTTSDGSKSSAVNIITKVDDNSFTWQSIDRLAGGELLPNVDEVVIVRQEAAKQ